MLVVLYGGVLYLILQSTDYALIAGSTLAFLALAATMFATRNEEWYGAPKQPGGQGGVFARLRGGRAPAQVPPPRRSSPSNRISSNARSRRSARPNSGRHGPSRAA